MQEKIQTIQKNVEELLVVGNLDNALKTVEEMLAAKDLTKREQQTGLVLLAHIQNYFGYHKKALATIKKLFEEKIKEKIILINAEIEQLTAKHHLGKITVKDIGQKVDYLLQEIKSLAKKTKQEYPKQQGTLLGLKGYLMGGTGFIDEGLEYLDKSIAIFDKLKSKNTYIEVSTQKAFVQMINQELDQAQEILERNLKQAQALGNKREEAFVYQRFAVLSSFNFDIPKSIELYLKSEQIMQDGKSLFYYGALHNNLADSYLRIVHLDEALASCKKAQEYSFSGKHHLYNTMASVYRLRNELPKALQSYQKALSESQKDHDFRLTPLILYNLIRVTLEEGKTEAAKEYFKQLEELWKKHTTAHTTKFYKFAAVMLYKTSEKISDWGKAADLLADMIPDTTLDDEYWIDALFSMLEIRIKELTIHPTKEALLKVNKQLEALQREAQEKKFYAFLVNIYRLEAKTALVELNIKRALELLVVARVLAEKNNLELLVQQTLKDQQEINDKLSLWLKFQKENTSLMELIQAVQLESVTKAISKDVFLEIRKEPTEEIIEYRKLFSLKL